MPIMAPHQGTKANRSGNVGDYLSLWNSIGEQAYLSIIERFGMAQRDIKRAIAFFGARYSASMHDQRISLDMKSTTCISEDLTARHVWASLQSSCQKQSNAQVIFAQSIKKHVLEVTQQLGDELKVSLENVSTTVGESKKKLEDQNRLTAQLKTKLEKLSMNKNELEIQLAQHESCMSREANVGNTDHSQGLGTEPRTTAPKPKSSLVSVSMNFFKSKQSRDETTLLKLRSKVNKLGDECEHVKSELQHQQNVLTKTEHQHSSTMREIMKELEFLELKRLQVMQQVITTYNTHEKELYRNLYEIAENRENSASKLSSRDDIRAFRRQLQPSDLSTWSRLSGNVPPISWQFIPKQLRPPASVEKDGCIPPSPMKQEGGYVSNSNDLPKQRKRGKVAISTDTHESIQGSP